MVDPLKILGKMRGGDTIYADVYSEERSYTLVQMESDRIERLEKGLDQGTGLRVITPWKTFYGSTNSSNPPDILDLAGTLGRFATGSQKPLPARNQPLQAPQNPFRGIVDPGSVDVAEKIRLVKRLDTLVKAMEKRVRQVRVIYRDSLQKVELYNDGGDSIEETRRQLVLNLLVIGEEDGEMQTAYEAVGGAYGFEFLNEAVIEELAAKTVKRLSGLLGAKEAPMGTRTVVLASEAGGTMIHEAIGHGLEADLAMEGLSCYKGMLGERIASPLIDVVDDATLPQMRGSFSFDDEGVAGERTVLVKDGVLTNYLFDRFHALKYGMRSTGNGRRESFRFKPIPRMSNTMILPGEDDPSRIVASVDDGVYVVRMGGGQVDTVRGDFVFEISEGYIIEKGKIGEMIKNATMMGNGPRVLKEIDMVGSDLGFGIGTCGKDGQGAPVSDAQPTLRIPQIVVGGREQS
jgi:TldD protein